jgi:hypothetical protein
MSTPPFICPYELLNRCEWDEDYRPPTTWEELARELHNPDFDSDYGYELEDLDNDWELPRHGTQSNPIIISDDETTLVSDDDTWYGTSPSPPTSRSPSPILDGLELVRDLRLRRSSAHREGAAVTNQLSLYVTTLDDSSWAVCCTIQLSGISTQPRLYYSCFLVALLFGVVLGLGIF